MALLQAVLSDPNHPIVTYPHLNTDDEEDGRPPKQNILQRIVKTIRQFLNVLPGILLLCVAGCQIIWEIREIIVERMMQDSPRVENGTDAHFVITDITLLGLEVRVFAELRWSFLPILLAWYICIIFGTCIGAFFNGLLAVKIVYSINAVVCLICGVIYIFSSVAIVPIIYIGRLVSGLIIGINYITIIIHAADNSSREVRGSVVRCVPYCALAMVLLYALNARVVSYTSLYTYIIFGVIYVSMAVLSLIANYCCVYNSITHSLDTLQNEDAVRHGMLSLRMEFRHPSRTAYDLNEMKLMLNEDKANGKNIFSNGNLRPLLLVGGARVLSVLINNIPLYLIVVSLLSLVWISTLVFGWLTIVVADFIALRINPNRFFYVASIIWCVVLIISHIVYGEYFAYAVIIGYAIISLGIEAISYNQLSEAFALTKRAWSIALITIVEYSVHICILVFYILLYPTVLLIVIVIGIVVLCVVLFKLMPNTHGKSLRDARKLFNNSIAWYPLRKYDLELTSH